MSAFEQVFYQDRRFGIEGYSLTFDTNLSTFTACDVHFIFAGQRNVETLRLCGYDAHLIDKLEGAVCVRGVAPRGSAPLSVTVKLERSLTQPASFKVHFVSHDRYYSFETFNDPAPTPHLDGSATVAHLTDPTAHPEFFYSPKQEFALIPTHTLMGKTDGFSLLTIKPPPGVHVSRYEIFRVERGIPETDCFVWSRPSDHLCIHFSRPVFGTDDTAEIISHTIKEGYVRYTLKVVTW